MQIIPFPAHYQSVYTNFDISSFSLISCLAKGELLESISGPFAKQIVPFRKSPVESLERKSVKNSLRNTVNQTMTQIYSNDFQPSIHLVFIKGKRTFFFFLLKFINEALHKWPSTSGRPPRCQCTGDDRQLKDKGKSESYRTTTLEVRPSMLTI